MQMRSIIRIKWHLESCAYIMFAQKSLQSVATIKKNEKGNNDELQLER